jgi:hypothetical protein
MVGEIERGIRLAAMFSHSLLRDVRFMIRLESKT